MVCSIRKFRDLFKLYWWRSWSRYLRSRSTVRSRQYNSMHRLRLEFLPRSRLPSCYWHMSSVSVWNWNSSDRLHVRPVHLCEHHYMVIPCSNWPICSHSYLLETKVTFPDKHIVVQHFSDGWLEAPFCRSLKGRRPVSKRGTASPLS